MRFAITVLIHLSRLHPALRVWRLLRAGHLCSALVRRGMEA